MMISLLLLEVYLIPTAFNKNYIKKLTLLILWGIVMNKKLKFKIYTFLFANTFLIDQLYAMDDYFFITDQDRSSLVHKLELKKSIIMESDSKLHTTYFPCVEWDHKNLLNRKPPYVLDLQKTHSLSKMEHEIKKSNSLSIEAKVGGDVGIFGGSVSSNYNSLNSTYNKTTETDIHLLCVYNAPKAELWIQKHNIKATQQLENEVGNAVKNNDIGAFIQLKAIFKKYGFSVPTKFVLGGRIFWEETKKLRGNISAEKHESDFALSISANCIFVSAKGGSKTGNQSSSTTITNNEKYNTTMHFIGGSPAFPDNPSGWANSLNSWKHWAVIGREEFYPIIDFLNPALRSQCKKLLQTYDKAICSWNELSLQELQEVEILYNALKSAGAPNLDILHLYDISGSLRYGTHVMRIYNGRMKIECFKYPQLCVNVSFLNHDMNYREP